MTDHLNLISTDMTYNSTGHAHPYIALIGNTLKFYWNYCSQIIQ